MEKNTSNRVKFNEFAERVNDATKRIVEIALEFETVEGYQHDRSTMPDRIIERAKIMLDDYQTAQYELKIRKSNVEDGPVPFGS